MIAESLKARRGRQEGKKALAIVLPNDPVTY
jgi:hypothetical protein